MCPRSSDPFYIVTYSIKWVTTSWIYSIVKVFDTIQSLAVPRIDQKQIVLRLYSTNTQKKYQYVDDSLTPKVEMFARGWDSASRRS